MDVGITTTPIMPPPTVVEKNQPQAGPTIRRNTEEEPYKRITKTRKMGEGTYGIVYTAQPYTGPSPITFAGLKERPTKNRNTKYVPPPPPTPEEMKNRIAVKRNLIDRATDFIGSLKELDVLSRLNGHPFIVKLVDISFGDPFNNAGGMLSPLKIRGLKDDAVHFLFEHALYDGHSFLYTMNSPIPDLKLGIVQLLLAIEYIHSRGIIHRDIKPSNILMFKERLAPPLEGGVERLAPPLEERDTHIFKLCDFGLSKFTTNQGRQSPRVVTSWYRAPEISLEWPNYTSKTDMWSLGCVFFEFTSKRPLLQDARDRDATIIASILGALPEPVPLSILSKMLKGKRIPATWNTATSVPRERRRSWTTQIGFDETKIHLFDTNGSGTFSEYLDLINHLLCFDPDSRWSATEALASPFCRGYMELIERTRAQYPRLENPSLLIVHDCIERKWASQVSFTIFNNRHALPWYRHRVLFQAIDIFDRYLNSVISTATTKHLESNDRGCYLTRYEVELRFTVCLYVSIKYFSTLNIPISYSELATDSYKTPEAMLVAERFELTLIRDILKYAIYRPTLYEIADVYADILDEKAIRDLLMVYGSLTSFSGLGVDDLYRLYKIAMQKK